MPVVLERPRGPRPSWACGATVARPARAGADAPSQAWT